MLTPVLVGLLPAGSRSTRTETSSQRRPALSVFFSEGYVQSCFIIHTLEAMLLVDESAHTFLITNALGSTHFLG